MALIDIDKAFVQAFIDNAYGIDIAYENSDYVPTAGTPYARLLQIPNDVTPLTMTGTDVTDGLFRVFLHYPDNTGAIAAKTTADSIINDFKIGTVLTYNSQKVTIKRVDRQPGANESGWYKIILSFGYWAAIAR